MKYLLLYTTIFQNNLVSKALRQPSHTELLASVR